MQTEEFLKALASKEAVPGGGGVSALMGSLAAALCSMVGNLTTGKKKYAEFEPAIQEILKKAEASRNRLYDLIEEDAKAFKPLAEAYAIPKDDPTRSSVMEKALKNACVPPMDMMEETLRIVDLIEELAEKGSRLAVSDVGVAAAAAKAAMEGAIMNVIINCNSMEDSMYAAVMAGHAVEMLREGQDRCDAVYNYVFDTLTRN